MYWDGGEDLHVGRALDNYVSFTAQLTWQAPVRRPRPAQGPSQCGANAAAGLRQRQPVLTRCACALTYLPPTAPGWRRTCHAVAEAYSNPTLPYPAAMHALTGPLLSAPGARVQRPADGRVHGHAGRRGGRGMHGRRAVAGAGRHRGAGRGRRQPQQRDGHGARAGHARNRAEDAETAGAGAAQVAPSLLSAMCGVGPWHHAVTR
jgi:hypothetical protein